MRPNALTSPKRINVLALIMLISYLLIHHYDTKWSLPVLMWALMGVVGAPPLQRFMCLLPILSWLSLWWLVAPRFNRPFLLWPLGCMWMTILFPAAYQLRRPVDYEWFWFWIPSLLFIGSSLLVARRLVFNWDDAA